MAQNDPFWAIFGTHFGTPPERSRLPYVWVLAKKGSKMGPKMTQKWGPLLSRTGQKASLFHVKWPFLTPILDPILTCPLLQNGLLAKMASEGVIFGVKTRKKGSKKPRGFVQILSLPNYSNRLFGPFFGTPK